MILTIAAGTAAGTVSKCCGEAVYARSKMCWAANRPPKAAARAPHPTHHQAYFRRLQLVSLLQPTAAEIKKDQV
jgi:hypothetical protein